MTELEKLHAGLEYDMWAPEIDALKLRAMTLCRRLNALPKEAKEERTAVMRELFGSVGENAAVMPYFSCDDGKSIFIGKNFLANYNVSILDRAPVRIGDYVMIGPHTLIATVNHPISPMGRRKHLSVAKPVTIGNDVWIGGTSPKKRENEKSGIAMAPFGGGLCRLYVCLVVDAAAAGNGLPGTVVNPGDGAGDILISNMAAQAAAGLIQSIDTM